MANTLLSLYTSLSDWDCCFFTILSHRVTRCTLYDLFVPLDSQYPEKMSSQKVFQLHEFINFYNLLNHLHLIIFLDGKQKGAFDSPRLCDSLLFWTDAKLNLFFMTRTVMPSSCLDQKARQEVFFLGLISCYSFRDLSLSIKLRSPLMFPVFSADM